VRARKKVPVGLSVGQSVGRRVDAGGAEKLRSLFKIFILTPGRHTRSTTRTHQAKRVPYTHTFAVHAVFSALSLPSDKSADDAVPSCWPAKTSFIVVCVACSPGGAAYTSPHSHGRSPRAVVGPTRAITQQNPETRYFSQDFHA
jgi:hypothetical protein